MTESEIIEIVRREYAYWRDQEESKPEFGDIFIGTAAATSNILGAIFGHPAPWHLDQPGDSNLMYPAEVKTWGWPWFGLIRLRVVLKPVRAWRTFWQVCFWKFSIGIAFPPFIANLFGEK